MKLRIRIISVLLMVMMWVVFSAPCKNEDEVVDEIEEPVFINRLELEGWEPDVRIVRDDGSINHVVLKDSAVWIARVIDCTVPNGSEAQWETVAWCVINRSENADYPSKIADVCTQKGQFTGLDKNEEPTEEKIAVAFRVLRAHYIEGIAPCGNEFVFLNVNGKTAVLRDSFYESSNTHYFSV